MPLCLHRKNVLAISKNEITVLKDLRKRPGLRREPGFETPPYEYFRGTVNQNESAGLQFPTLQLDGELFLQN